MLVVDDYGHHPTELAATIAAARLYGRRLVVAFQPHRFTRTRDLLDEFAPALAGADELLLTDIYAAGETPDRAASTPTRCWRRSPTARARHVSRDRLAAALAEAARPGDLVLCLGAGDITGVPTELLALLGGEGAVMSAPRESHEDAPRSGGRRPDAAAPRLVQAAAATGASVAEPVACRRCWRSGARWIGRKLLVLARCWW